MMGLDLYFAEDIRNALLAANEGSAATAAVVAKTDGDMVALWAYREGYKAALITVALAFGIAPQNLRMEANYERAIDGRTGDVKPASRD